MSTSRTPAQRRYSAIGEITEKATAWNEDRTEATFGLTMKQVPEIVAEIRALAPLGRSRRWKEAVENWARLVEFEATEHGLRGFEWSVTQGSIWTLYAAE